MCWNECLADFARNVCQWDVQKSFDDALYVVPKFRQSLRGDGESIRFNNAKFQDGQLQVDAFQIV